MPGANRDACVTEWGLRTARLCSPWPSPSPWGVAQGGQTGRSGTVMVGGSLVLGCLLPGEQQAWADPRPSTLRQAMGVNVEQKGRGGQRDPGCRFSPSVPPRWKRERGVCLTRGGAGLRTQGSRDPTPAPAPRAEPPPGPGGLRVRQRVGKAGHPCRCAVLRKVGSQPSDRLRTLQTSRSINELGSL